MRSFTVWRWHLHEVYIRNNSEMHSPWGSVDHEGEVLELFVGETMGQGHERTPAVPTTRTGHGEVGADEETAEV
jgi:hypothetical protein